MVLKFTAQMVRRNFLLQYINLTLLLIAAIQNLSRLSN